MEEPFDKPTVLRLLEELQQNDSRQTLFGAGEHGYELNPPLSLSEIEHFERQYAISLPEDYRYFITEIGNGGAGPYYGLFPFGQDESSATLRPWENGDLIGDVSKPFPHTEAWNLPDSFWEQEPDVPPGTPSEEEDRIVEEWDKVEQEHYWNPAIMNGAIPICHRGCALWLWLVVHGEQRGFIWTDDRADHGGIAPLRDDSGRQMTFSDWYMSWLHTSIRTAQLESQIVSLLNRGKRRKAVEYYGQQAGSDLAESERAVKYIAARHGVAKQRLRRRDLAAVVILMAVGVLLGLLLGQWRRKGRRRH